MKSITNYILIITSILFMINCGSIVDSFSDSETEATEKIKVKEPDFESSSDTEETDDEPTYEIPTVG